jgi:hypothetical protein
LILLFPVAGVDEDNDGVDNEDDNDVNAGNLIPVDNVT